MRPPAISRTKREKNSAQFDEEAYIKEVPENFELPAPKRSRKSYTGPPRTTMKKAQVEPVLADFFILAEVPFEMAETEPFRKMMKALNTTYGNNMSAAEELERKYSWKMGGTCFVCKTSFTNKRKSLQMTLNSNDTQLWEVLGKNSFE